MPIFPKPIDLAADYVWTGDHTFDGVVTCNGDFNAVDGSFTGNLTSEVGGSYKLYNLGDESATDSEFVSMAWDASKLKILTDKTGSGAVRDIELSANQVALKYNSGTSVSTRVSCDSNSIKVWRNLYNGVNGLYA
ncbi:hypothetical protein OAU14_00480, partial [bacterium]|nr:hypothetical protein [bacterium]